MFGRSKKKVSKKKHEVRLLIFGSSTIFTLMQSRRVRTSGIASFCHASILFSPCTAKPQVKVDGQKPSWRSTMGFPRILSQVELARTDLKHSPTSQTSQNVLSRFYLFKIHCFDWSKLQWLFLFFFFFFLLLLLLLNIGPTNGWPEFQADHATAISPDGQWLAPGIWSGNRSTGRGTWCFWIDLFYGLAVKNIFASFLG